MLNSDLINTWSFIHFELENKMNKGSAKMNSGIVQMFGGKKISTITYHHIKKKIINYKLTNTNPILITKNNMNTHK